MNENHIKRTIDIEIRKDTPSTSARGFGIGLFISKEDLTPHDAVFFDENRKMTFTSFKSVQNIITNESVLEAASLYFNQDSFLKRPDKLVISKYFKNGSHALLKCGIPAPLADFQALDTGRFAIIVDGGSMEVAGLNMAMAETYDDLAENFSVTGLLTCVYDGEKFIFYSKSSGTQSTITALEDPTIGDSLVSLINGGVSDSEIIDALPPETPLECIDSIMSVDNSWHIAALEQELWDTQDVVDFSTAIESKQKAIFITTYDPKVLDINTQDQSLLYSIYENGRSRTLIQYCDETEKQYFCMSLMGKQLPKEIGSTNWAYQENTSTKNGALVDVNPVDLSSDELEALKNINIGSYIETLDAAYTYEGRTMNGGYIDEIRNIDFLKSKVEEGYIDLFVSKENIPLTDGGITMVENRLRRDITNYGQNFIDFTTLNIIFPKRSELTQEMIADREIGIAIFNFTMNGAINKVVVRGTVY